MGLGGTSPPSGNVGKDVLTPTRVKSVQLDLSKAVAGREKEHAEVMTIQANGDAEMRRASLATSGSLASRPNTSRVDTSASLSRSVASQLTYRNLLTGTNSMQPGILMKPQSRVEKIDRWTPRSKQKKQQQESSADSTTRLGTAWSASNDPEFQGFDTQKPDKKVMDVQKKIQEQLKSKRQIRIQTADADSNELDDAHFHKTLKSYGIHLEKDDADLIFKHYDKNNSGSLDYEQFMQGVRGSEFVLTSRSMGFETPDPDVYASLHNHGEIEHYIPVTEDIKPNTARGSKAWSQQRAADSCPFGSDRKVFGGKWMYRTSSLVKAEPVVASRYGKTSFPARKGIADVVHVIAEKLQERAKTSLSFTRMFNQFDADRSGQIDCSEFEKMLQLFNIQLNQSELAEVFEHFGDGKDHIKYKDFVHVVEGHFRSHPLGGFALAGNQ